ncbi:MAG: hypothetical protein U0R19_32925 [Bryobacteraceae bacterium]
MTIALAALSVNIGQAANLLLNPSFEAQVTPGTNAVLATGSTFLTNWTVTGSACSGNCVFLLDSTYTENIDIGLWTTPAVSGDQSLDITGAGNTVDGGIEQTVTLNLVPHVLSFWVGNGDNRSSFLPLPSTIEVFVNSISQGTFTNNDSTNNQTNWKQFSLTFTPNVAVNTIRFRNATPVGDNMAGLDDVFLEETPEPGTSALVGGALLVVMARRFYGARSRGQEL